MISNVWQLALFLYLLHEHTQVLVTFQHYQVTHLPEVQNSVGSFKAKSRPIRPRRRRGWPENRPTVVIRPRCKRQTPRVKFHSNNSTWTKKTRSSATAEKQRGSCACLPTLANGSCRHCRAIHITLQNHTGCTISDIHTVRFDSRSAGQKRILSWNSHSRSFTLQSFAGRQGVAFRHILLLAVSVKF